MALALCVQPLVKVRTVNLYDGVRVEPSFCSSGEPQRVVYPLLVSPATQSNAFRLTHLCVPFASAQPDVGLALDSAEVPRAPPAAPHLCSPPGLRHVASLHEGQ